MLRFRKEDGSSYPDWDEKGFYEVFELLQNNTFSRDMLNYDDGEVQNVHYGDVLVKYGDVLDCEKELLPFINSDVSVMKYNTQSYIKDGDVVLADTAEDFTAGKVTEVCNVGDKKILSGLHTMLCRPKEEFAKGFLGHYLNSNAYHKQIIPLLVGTKVYSINKKVIGDTKLKIPCMEEQKKIAESLSTIDEKINTQESVIADLEDIKKGTIQKIFDQEIRFKEDNGKEFPEWKHVQINDVANVSGGYAFDSKKMTSQKGMYQIIKMGNLYQGALNLERNQSYINEPTLKELDYLLKDGDIAITLTGTINKRDYGYSHQFTTERNLLLNQRLGLIRGKDIIHKKYLDYVVKSQEFLNQFYSTSTGGTGNQTNVSTKDIEKIIVTIPCFKEQKKIADCLFALDKKIEVEKKILEDWKQLKKALLQQMFV